MLDLRELVDSFDALVVIVGPQRPSGALHRRGDRAPRRPGARGASRSTWRVWTAGEWVALDYGDVIVHVFDEAAREYYDLEHLWSAAPASRPERAR